MGGTPHTPPPPGKGAKVAGEAGSRRAGLVKHAPPPPPVPQGRQGGRQGSAAALQACRSPTPTRVNRAAFQGAQSPPARARHPPARVPAPPPLWLPGCDLCVPREGEGRGAGGGEGRGQVRSSLLFLCRLRARRGAARRGAAGPSAPRARSGLHLAAGTPAGAPAAPPAAVRAWRWPLPAAAAGGSLLQAERAARACWCWAAQARAGRAGVRAA